MDGNYSLRILTEKEQFFYEKFIKIPVFYENFVKDTDATEFVRCLCLYWGKLTQIIRDKY
ncbi:hypothetical protein IJ00_17010 [Calothrix sp. 336/3]|nr:hypothetical protein IJ00_17010 [Calothrix sp. 336/3]